jgi:hypothetical protein
MRSEKTVVKEIRRWGGSLFSPGLHPDPPPNGRGAWNSGAQHDDVLRRKRRNRVIARGFVGDQLVNVVGWPDE